MAAAPFRKQGGGTDDEFRKQSNVEAALNPLRNSIILDGVFLESVQVYTIETIIAHKLGRPARGYIVCGNDKLNYISKTNGTFDKTLFIGLVASTDCVLSLWIF